MLLEGTIAELIVKLEPDLYRKYIWYNHKNGLHTTREGTLWNVASSLVILQAIIQFITVLGIQDQ